MSDDESQLSAHIRHLLLSYVHTHITTPYVPFTQQAVFELLSDLSLVPTDDPTALILPTDPLTTYLSTISNTIEPYAEKLQTTNDARLLIKRLLASKPPRQLMLVDDYDNDKYYRRPTPPILTRRAVRETPVIGKQAPVVKSYAKYIATTPHPLCPATPEEITEPTVDINQVLDLKHSIRAADHDAVRALLKYVAAKPPGQGRVHAFLPPSLTPKTQVVQQHTPPSSSPPFLPIFPRRFPVCPPRKGRSGHIQASQEGVSNARKRDISSEKRGIKGGGSNPTIKNTPESMADLVGLITPITGADIAHSHRVSPGGNGAKLNMSEEEDLYKENMVVVNGWETYATSSPSVLSESSDEEDQLFLPSSPDTDVGGGGGRGLGLVGEVEKMKMEEIQIPRARRIGGTSLGNSNVNSSIGKTGYRQFLTPLLRNTVDAGAGGDSVTDRSQESVEFNPGRELHPQLLQSEKNQYDLESLSGHPAVTQSEHTSGSRSDEGRDEDEEIQGLYTALAFQHNTKGVGIDVVASDLQDGNVPRPYDLIRDEQLFSEDDKAMPIGEDLKGVGRGDIRIEKNKGSGKDGVGSLMPVPVLSEPNTYYRTHTRAISTLSGYVITGDAGSAPVNWSTSANAVTGEENRLAKFLKKVKGIAGLRVALSWIPFTLSSPAELGDHAKVVHVDGLLSGSEDKGEDIVLIKEKVRRLLSRSAVIESDEGVADGTETVGANEREGKGQDVGERLWNVFGDKSDSIPLDQGVWECEVVLTRRERLGLSRMDGAESIQREAGMEQVHGRRRGVGSEKRKFLHAEEQLSENEVPAKKKKGDMLISVDEVDDSGIGMMVDEQEIGGEEIGRNWEDDMLDLDASFAGENALVSEEEKENWPPILQKDYGTARLIEVDNFDENNYGRDSVSNDLGRFVRHQHIGQSEHEQEGQLIEMNQDGYTDGQLDKDHYMESEYGYGYDLGRQDNDQDHIGGSFEPLPLSFDSQNYRTVSTHPSQSQTYGGYSQDGGRPSQNQGRYIQGQERTHDHSEDPYLHGELDDSHDIETLNKIYEDKGSVLIQTPTKANAKKIPNADLSPAAVLVHHELLEPPELATYTLGIEMFAKLRGKVLKPNPSPVKPQPQNELPIARPQGPPPDLYDHKTLRLPAHLVPMSRHLYLASLELLQKQALVRALRSVTSVELIERHTLGGADLLLDAHNALIFAPLLSLPSQKQAEALMARVAEASWSVEQLLVVFEAYPEVRSTKGSAYSAVTGSSGSSLPASHLNITAEPELYAYTPPIMKAIKKFRRDMDIAEACGTKSDRCSVRYAFADSVDEAARYARLFGDDAEKAHISGSNAQSEGLWGDREWLDLDLDEDEASLGAVKGMNMFKASIVLCQITIQEFLDLHPEERVNMFGHLIGYECLIALNEELERKLQAMNVYEDGDEMAMKDAITGNSPYPP